MNNTKKAIFDSAIKIFSMNGYDGATMDDISQNAGVAKGTLYYHFKSKEEIFNFIIREGLSTIKERTNELIKLEGDGVSKLLALCKIQLNLVTDYKDFMKVIMSQIWSDNSRHLELRNAILEYIRDVENYVKLAIDNNLIKNDDSFLLSCSIIGSVCSLAINNLIKNENIDNDTKVNKVIEYLLDGIRLDKNA